VLATPAGISGAVLLLPFQVGILGTPSPAVTPTNLLYNIVAAPGALYRFWRQEQSGGGLAKVLIAGTLPGVVAGSVIRVLLLPGARVFDLVVAVVLLPLGTWIGLTRSPHPPAGITPRNATAPPGPTPTGPTQPHPPAGTNPRRVVALPAPALVGLAVLVGCVGGIYGIGGGSILAPVLIATGRPPAEVAPAALSSTFVTSVAGVITFTALALVHHSQAQPDWSTGIALGFGGLIGAYVGARLQPRLPDLLIRRAMSVLIVAIAARYLWAGLT